MWKIKAFIDMVKSIDCSLVTNIVCVGDSFIEIEAAKACEYIFSKFSSKRTNCLSSSSGLGTSQNFTHFI